MDNSWNNPWKLIAIAITAADYLGQC